MDMPSVGRKLTRNQRIQKQRSMFFVTIVLLVKIWAQNKVTGYKLMTLSTGDTEIVGKMNCFKRTN